MQKNARVSSLTALCSFVIGAPLSLAVTGKHDEELIDALLKSLRVMKKKAEVFGMAVIYHNRK